MKCYYNAAFRAKMAILFVALLFHFTLHRNAVAIGNESSFDRFGQNQPRHCLWYSGLLSVLPDGRLDFFRGLLLNDMNGNFRRRAIDRRKAKRTEMRQRVTGLFPGSPRR